MRYFFLLFGIFISTLKIFAQDTLTTPVQQEFYGQEMILSGAIEKRNIYNPTEEVIEEIWILQLDQAIDTLPMPQIGEDKREVKKIQEVILYGSAILNLLNNDFFQPQNVCKIKVRGTIWYADWWIESMPFLLIVEEIYID